MPKGPTPKTDAMRADRERRYAEQQALKKAAEKKKQKKDS